MNYNIRQRGSALFVILVGVVLFAALSYTVAQMMRGGNPMIINEEKSRLYADELLNYARAMRQSTQNVKINGCADLNISYEAAGLTGYTHTPAAADACKIFHEKGGAVNYLVPSTDWLDMNVNPAPALRGQWFFLLGFCVPGVGNALANCETDGTDNETLMAMLPYVRKEVCVEANKLLNVANIGNEPPPLIYTGTWALTKYAGAQSNVVALDTGGKMGGCYEGDGSALPAGTYHFFQVLLPR
jgi:hypothetical protein